MTIDELKRLSPQSKRIRDLQEESWQAVCQSSKNDHLCFFDIWTGILIRTDCVYKPVRAHVYEESQHVSK